MHRDNICNLYNRPPIDASYQVQVHQAQWLQRKRFFRNRSIRNKNCLWWPCLLTDQNEMINLSRGPSNDASYQISVHLAKRFERRSFFQKLTNQKQELPMPAMFANGTGRNAHIFQRTFQGCFLPNGNSLGQAVSDQKIFFRIQTNQIQELHVAAMFANETGRHEQTLQRTFQ